MQTESVNFKISEVVDSEQPFPAKMPGYRPIAVRNNDEYARKTLVPVLAG